MARRRALVNACGLSGRWALASFEGAEVDGHNRVLHGYLKEWVRRAVDGFFCMYRPGVLMYGPTGCGKSWAGACCVNALVDAGVAARFLRVVEMPKHDQDAVEELADVGRVPVLVLDDLGAEKRTDRAMECLYTVLDGRAHADAPTVLTTNWKPEALAAAINRSGPGYGDKILSRLHGLCEFVPVGGPDRRLV